MIQTGRSITMGCNLGRTLHNSHLTHAPKGQNDEWGIKMMGRGTQFVVGGAKIVDGGAKIVVEVPLFKQTKTTPLARGYCYFTFFILGFIYFFFLFFLT